MWPWEHVAVAYVLYSLYCRLRSRSPGAGPVLVLAFGAVLPDLVDKPLAWTFALVPQGYSVAHSVLVAPLLLAAVAAVCARLRRPTFAVAFAVGHLSHLVGDVVYPVVEGEGLAFEAVLWPLVTLPAYEVRRSAVERALYYLARHVHRVLEHGVGPLVAFELGLVAAVLGLWLSDGAPVLREAVRAAAVRVRD